MPNTSTNAFNPVAVDDNIIEGVIYSVYEDDILDIKSMGDSVLANDTDGDPGEKLAAYLHTGPVNPLFDLDTNGKFIFDANYHEILYVDDSGSDDVLSATDGGGSNFELTNGFDSLGRNATIYDSFVYIASDGEFTDSATATIEILGVNDAPVADDDSAVVTAGSTDTVIDALDGDTDVDIWPVSDTLSIVALSDTGDSDNDPFDANGLSITTDAGGVVTLLPDGTLEYDAPTGFFGIDTFEYVVADGSLLDPETLTDTGTVRVTVLPANEGPVAVSDTYTISEGDGEALFGDDDPSGEKNVLANDTDGDSEPIAAELIGSSGATGTAIYEVDDMGDPVPGSTNTGILTDFNSDGTFNYDPNGEFDYLGLGQSAYVQFKYWVIDGSGASSSTTVTIEIEGENNPPSAGDPGDGIVYEAGLDTASHKGSGDGSTSITYTFTFSIQDDDTGDTPTVTFTAGSFDGTESGTYGNWSVTSATTIVYTLTDAANHTAGGDHNGGIFDTIGVYIWDGTASSSEITVDVEVIDDINFLAALPNGASGANIIDDRTVSYSDGATATDTFTLIPGADDQGLDIVGIPNSFSFAVTGGTETITSSVVTDSQGFEIGVEGRDSDGDPFYTLDFTEPAFNGTTGSYVFEVHQNPPTIANEIDFSAISAGGPQESPTVENITFDGGFIVDFDFDDDGGAGEVLQGMVLPGDLFPFDDLEDSQSEDINPNNAGGIGVGNGNIDPGEVLCIDVSGSAAEISGVRFTLKGVGGGVDDAEEVVWVAVADVSGTDTIVASGTKTTTDINQKDGEEVLIDPGVEFDQLYVAINLEDPEKVRINKIETIEEVAANDIVLGFRVNSDDGDGDESPAGSFEEFEITIDGLGTGDDIDQGIMGV